MCPVPGEKDTSCARSDRAARQLGVFMALVTSCPLLPEDADAALRCPPPSQSVELVAPFGGSPHRGDLPHSASMGALIGDGSSAEGRPGLGEDDDLDSNPSVRRVRRSFPLFPPSSPLQAPPLSCPPYFVSELRPARGYTRLEQ